MGAISSGGRLARLRFGQGREGAVCFWGPRWAGCCGMVRECWDRLAGVRGQRSYIWRHVRGCLIDDGIEGVSRRFWQVWPAALPRWVGRVERKRHGLSVQSGGGSRHRHCIALVAVAARVVGPGWIRAGAVCRRRVGEVMPGGGIARFLSGCLVLCACVGGRRMIEQGG